MREAGRYIVVLDPYEWMPGYGENSVEIFTRRTEGLTVVVTYDREEGGEEQKEIKFTDVSYFSLGAFPGSTVTEECSKDTPWTSLVEFPDSKRARAWMEYYKEFAHYDRVVKHYLWIFMAENLVLEVFAGGVQWEDHSS
jgi:hypothetical protein